MAPDPRSQPFVGLSDIDRLSVVIEERVDAPSVISHPDVAARGIGERGVEELRQASPQIFGLEGGDVEMVSPRPVAEVKHGGSP